ncbi:MAG: dynamin family protein [Xenococcaceae cyanobacterium]
MNQTQLTQLERGTFRDYKKKIISLINSLKQLQDFAKKLKLDRCVTSIDEVLYKISTNSFSVAVVGEFKRGKSTFINALVGEEILPADILPCSATVNRVTYGTIPRVKIVFRDGREETIEIDKLGEYVTKLTPESEEVAATVKEAIVYYPVHYCHNNVDIIDTPGLNDEERMTEVTLSLLPSVDVAIMVVMAQSPFSEYEREFLENNLLSCDLGKIIFVVTGIDRFNNPADIDKGLRYIEDRIQKMVMQRAKEEYGANSPEYEVYQKKIGKPRIFGLSAYQALQAKQNGDAQLLKASRFCEFEAELEKFLVVDRGTNFLQVPINRLLASATEILKTIELQKNALAMKQEDFQSAYNESIAKLGVLRERNAEEMLKIDVAAAKLKKQVQPLVAQLEYKIRTAAQSAIESIEIKPNELKNKKALSQKLAHHVSDAVQKAAQQQSLKIQSEIENGLVKEVYRLKEFAKSVISVFRGIETQFNTLDATSRFAKVASGDDLIEALAIFKGFNQIWSGDSSKLMQDAAVVTVGSVSTALAAGLVATVIGLPVTFPFVVAVGILSIFTGFTGSHLSQLFFAGDRVASLKTSFTQAVLQEIERQTQEKSLQATIERQIEEIFNALKQRLNSELECLLDDTTFTLTQLGAKRGRHEVLTEHESQELEEMRQKTELIRCSVKGLGIRG